MLVDNEVNGSAGPFEDFIEPSDGIVEKPEIVKVDVQDARHASVPSDRHVVRRALGSRASPLVVDLSGGDVSLWNPILLMCDPMGDIADGAYWSG